MTPWDVICITAVSLAVHDFFVGMLILMYLASKEKR
jgi:hypothetical protein